MRLPRAPACSQGTPAASAQGRCGVSRRGYCPRVRPGWKRAAWLAIAVVVGSVLVVLAAKVAARLYYDPALWALAGWVVAPDLGIFLEAGDAILDGRSPYQEVEGIGHYLGYVYPPLLAFAVIPLSVLPSAVAASIWALATFGFVAWSLWLLGVRDWRCYPVALLWPFTREAVEYGAIGPLLLLLVALLWRYRDRPWGAAGATAGSIAAKLFLWPLGLWLAFTGRVRAAALSIALTLVLVFVPWALIGFTGLSQYAELLDEVADQQDYRSYSVIALVRSIGGSPAVAQALSLVIGFALLVLALREARRAVASSRERDRRSLTLVLAAALVLTPVVWPHYLVLLLAPIALARPRLSGLWLFVLAATVLYAFDWYRASPEGEALPVVTITAIVAAVFLVAFRAREPAEGSTS
jgi:hypothetical protein